MLKDILAISGKPGLYKKINNTTRAIIVESLLDGKRSPVYSNEKVIALGDITMYADSGDVPLKEIFKNIFKKENGGPAISSKEPGEAIMNYMEEIVPDYDRERVYLSDMQKALRWYNILHEKGLLRFDEEPLAGEEKKETAEEAGA